MISQAELAAAAGLLREHSRVLVACHESPDGDALGSLIGAGRSLQDAGWDVAFWAPGDASLPADYDWLGLDHVARTPPSDASERILLAVDCGSAERLGLAGPATVASALASINLDHHGDNTRFAGLNLVDATSPCATILVLSLRANWVSRSASRSQRRCTSGSSPTPDASCMPMPLPSRTALLLS